MLQVMSAPCLVLPSSITPYEALSPQINGNPTQNYWLGPSDSHYSTLSNINIRTCIAASKTEDWEAEEKPASEVAIQMKLEFVRQDGKVSKLDICEGEDLNKVVSSFGRANGLDARLRDALYHCISTALKERAV